MREYASLLFSRGYLLTNVDLARLDSACVAALLSRWESSDVGSYRLLSAPELARHTYTDDTTHLVLLGDVIAPLENDDRVDTILARLHRAYRTSERAFFDYLDTLTGRFVLVVSSPSKSFVLQDATGNRSLFYDVRCRDVVVSSHVQLIAELHDYRIPEARRAFIASPSYQRNLRRFPGLSTPYAEIRTLTPNTLLDLEERRVVRFFPRDPLRRRTLSADLTDEIASFLRRQIGLLSRQHSLAVSLTGGLDSRMTLASARDVADQMFCYTFATDRNVKEQDDAELARKLCTRLGIEHRIIHAVETPSSRDDHEFLAIFRRHTAFMRADRQGMIAKALLEQFPSGVLHVKSNVIELAKAILRGRHRFLPKQVSPLLLAHLYSIEPRSPFCRSAFEEFIRSTHFEDAVALGYDVADLFHWEHHLGCWQALQLLDFDMSQEAIIPYNNRWLLRALLAIAPATRLHHAIHYAIIEALWPEVLELPVNPWEHQEPVGRRLKKVGSGLYWRLLTTVDRKHHLRR